MGVDAIPPCELPRGRRRSPYPLTSGRVATDVVRAARDPNAQVQFLPDQDEWAPLDGPGDIGETGLSSEETSATD